MLCNTSRMNRPATSPVTVLYGAITWNILREIRAAIWKMNCDSVRNGSEPHPSHLLQLHVRDIQGEHKVFPWLQTFITNVYLDMLELHVAPQLEEFQPWKIFQQDGAPPHWGSHVRRFLDVTFPNRWIGRDGPTPWPPRSPYITPLDFFLWGYGKDKVFSTPVPDITNLKAMITDAFATITEDMLGNTWREMIID